MVLSNAKKIATLVSQVSNSQESLANRSKALKELETLVNAGLKDDEQHFKADLGRFNTQWKKFEEAHQVFDQMLGGLTALSAEEEEEADQLYRNVQMQVDQEAQKEKASKSMDDELIQRLGALQDVSVQRVGKRLQDIENEARVSSPVSVSRADQEWLELEQKAANSEPLDFTSGFDYAGQIADALEDAEDALQRFEGLPGVDSGIPSDEELLDELDALMREDRGGAENITDKELDADSITDEELEAYLNADDGDLIPVKAESTKSKPIDPQRDVRQEALHKAAQHTPVPPIVQTPRARHAEVQTDTTVQNEPKKVGFLGSLLKAVQETFKSIGKGITKLFGGGSKEKEAQSHQSPQPSRRSTPEAPKGPVKRKESMQVIAQALTNWEQARSNLIAKLEVIEARKIERLERRREREQKRDHSPHRVKHSEDIIHKQFERLSASKTQGKTSVKEVRKDDTPEVDHNPGPRPR